ncbi:MAG: slipin family protein, partial [Candidatus Melainabacteria bacterium]|nr:slipin family protein [Candidatus Melainabacteria bacterium]
MLELLSILMFIGLVIVFASLRFVNEYDRLVIFRFGRVVGIRGPGPCLVLPVVEWAKKVDLRIIT